ncbi:MAG: long-chain fatty acid--CoA ligase [Bacteroidaceae bacterium]|nr:long-chain fatty acid--CoA ligase [Bacteroidaceae bacterium]
MPARQAEKYGEREAVRYKDYVTNEWISISWNKFKTLIDTAACALAQMGIKEKENITTFTQNTLYGLVVDHGAFQNRAVIAPLYATSSADQITYIINETESRFLFIGEQPQYDVWIQARANCPFVEHVIIFDRQVVRIENDNQSIYMDEFMALGENASDEIKAEVERRTRTARPEDLATLIYTSGTTGEPKGVMLTHTNYDIIMRIHRQRLTMIDDEDVSLSFLPMTHIFERAWSYFCLSMGVRVVINRDTKTIAATVKEVRPSLLCNVPRFWEKVYAGVQEFIARQSGVKAKMIQMALKTGRKYHIEYKSQGRNIPLLLNLQYKLFDKIILSKIRYTVGVNNGVLFPVAGAPLGDAINEFLISCGIPITYGYGLSETTATVSCFLANDYKIGTVGTVMPEIEVRIDTENNNEILVKSGTVMQGYYKKPEETAKVFTEDGWFRTGDAGTYIDGKLSITERIKDLFKTSNGKYIAPQAIESCLGGDRFIEQVAVIGDQRKYVTAIIVPAYEALTEYAQKMKIQFHTFEDLVKNQEIYAMIESRIAELQKNFASFEQIKKFTLLPHAFTMERGELTNTLKVRRSIINKIYKKEIELMYT